MAYQNVTDEKGLVNEGEFISAFIPSTGKVLIFWVKARINAGKEDFNYGPLPVTSATGSTAFSSETAGTWGTGIVGGESYNTTSFAFAPPSDLSGVFDSTDMWYLKKQYRKTLFHTILETTPAWLQIEAEIPKGVAQGRFQDEQGVQTGIGHSLGFARGSLEMLHIPELHIGYRFGNDTNLDAYTTAKFTYAENRIKIPTDPNLIFDILTQNRPSHWITLPVNTYDGSIRNAFVGDYGYEGFPLYDKSQRDAATGRIPENDQRFDPNIMTIPSIVNDVPAAIRQEVWL
jgi:hypothetical protein